MKTKITIEIKADEALIKAIENLIALIQASDTPSFPITTTWTCKPPFIPTAGTCTSGTCASERYTTDKDGNAIKKAI